MNVTEMLGFVTGNGVTAVEVFGFFLNQVAGFIFVNIPDPFSGVGPCGIGV